MKAILKFKYLLFLLKKKTIFINNIAYLQAFKQYIKNLSIYLGITYFRLFLINGNCKS